MTEDNDDNRTHPPNEQGAETYPPTTLLPMLIGGLILIIIGMIIVPTFA
jgi:hypothetical protein